MSDNQQLPQPDPALRRLDRLVGTRAMQANLAGSDPPTATFPSTVCSGVAPTPLPSRWDVPGADQTVSVPDDIGGHRLS
jgi:hypothetical protein